MTARRGLLLMAPLFLLAGCSSEGMPTTDTEAIMFGLVFLALIALAGLAIWRTTK